MTTTQQLLLLGTIWLAPQANRNYAFFASAIFLLLAACNGLKWI